VRDLFHLCHSLQINIFQKYDNGRKGNQKHYGKPYAPRYKLERITNQHIALISAKGHHLATPDNVNFPRQCMEVKSIGNYLIPYEGFKHLDFLVAMTAADYVNQKIVDILEKHQD
jgi:hypothetical protein